MITGGPSGKENQLEFALNTYGSRNGVRRSVLQVAVFNPNHDHSKAAQLGFPCLQHVTFAPVDGGLCLNGFYASQYMVERAYGNYVGLCRLGQFAAHELGLRLLRMTCFTGIAECEVAKRKLSGLMATLNGVVGREEQPGAEP
jgi:thymidylate synthase